MTLIDAGSTIETSDFSVIADITAPQASDVQTANVSGGTAGRAEQGDRLSLTYSEQIDDNSVLAGWGGTPTPVVVRLNNAAPDDRVQIYDTTNSAALPLGTVRLARSDYTTANRTFGATGTASTMVRSGSTITITLGTQSGATTTAGAGATMLDPLVDCDRSRREPNLDDREVGVGRRRCRLLSSRDT